MCKEHEEPLPRVQERDLGGERLRAVGTEVGAEAGRGDGVTRENVRRGRRGPLHSREQGGDEPPAPKEIRASKALVYRTFCRTTAL